MKSKYKRKTMQDILKEQLAQQKSEDATREQTRLQNLLTPELYKTLRETLTMSIEDFTKLPGANVTETADGPVIFIDNDADVLGVAHLDFVDWNADPIIDQVFATVDKTPQLDCRLGVWVLLHLLPTLQPGVKFDVLLTDSEEVGASTAKDFETDKEYRYAFEFDRNGTDIVTYQFGDDYGLNSDPDSLAWDVEAEKIANLGMGSFSDISYLQIGCKAFNIGVGYYQQHTKNCHAFLTETVQMAESFASWYFDTEGVFFPHEDKPNSNAFGYGSYGKGSTSTWQGYYAGYDDFDVEEETECPICRCLNGGQHLICTYCQEQIGKQYM